MTPEAFFSELRAVLATEREALRRMDSATVLAASEKKEALLAIVMNASDADRPAFLGALALAREELKRNLVVLAHARGLLREAIARARPQGTGPGVRVSIRL